MLCSLSNFGILYFLFSGRGGMKGGAKVVIEAHRHEGVFIARGKEDALVTLNSTPGKDVYGKNTRKLHSICVKCRLRFPLNNYCLLNINYCAGVVLDLLSPHIIVLIFYRREAYPSGWSSGS